MIFYLFYHLEIKKIADSLSDFIFCISFKAAMKIIDDFLIRLANEISDTKV